jgi:hypothetical protein
MSGRTRPLTSKAENRKPPSPRLFATAKRRPSKKQRPTLCKSLIANWRIRTLKSNTCIPLGENYRKSRHPNECILTSTLQQLDNLLLLAGPIWT